MHLSIGKCERMRVCMCDCTVDSFPFTSLIHAYLYFVKLNIFKSSQTKLEIRLVQRSRMGNHFRNRSKSTDPVSKLSTSHSFTYPQRKQRTRKKNERTKHRHSNKIKSTLIQRSSCERLCINSNRIQF